MRQLTVNKKICVVSVMLLYSGVCFSAPLENKNRFLQGQEYRSQKKFREALDAFSEAVKTEPSNDKKADIYIQMAVTHYDLGNWDSAIRNLEQAEKISDKFDQQAKYYIGLCYYAKRNKPLCEKAFREAVRLNTSPALSQISKFYLHRIENGPEERWSYLTGLGFILDTNMTTETSAGIVNDESVEDERGYATSLLFQPTYRQASGKHNVFSASYLAYGVYNWDRKNHKGYDLLRQAFTLGLDVPWDVGNRAISSTFRLSENIAFKGVKERDQDGGIKMLAHHQDFFISNAYFPYRRFRWSIPLHIGAYDFKSGRGDDDRDGYLFEAALLGTCFLRDAMDIAFDFGSRVTLEEAMGRNYRSRNHEQTAGLTFPFWFNITFGADASFTRKFFLASNTGRNDWRYAYNASLLKTFGSYGTKFTFTYIKNDSVLQRYDYKRFLATLNISRMF